MSIPYMRLHPMRIQRLSDAEYRQLLLMRALMLVWFILLLGGF